MSLSFVEAMRGWLVVGAGAGEIPVSFELRALQRQNGLFDVQGVLAAPPLARETPARGTLEIAVGRITYHLAFTATDRRALVLDAEKHPTLLAPLRSMTRMQAVIRDVAGDATLATGEMRFATRDVPGFVASWLLSSGRAHRELDVRRRRFERLALAGEGVSR